MVKIAKSYFGALIAKYVICTFYISFSFIISVIAQNVSSVDSLATKFTWQLQGGIETYWAYDTNNPFTKEAPAWVYAYTRHNQVGINIAFGGFRVFAPRFRSQLAFALGDYMQKNYAAEPIIFRNLLEAQVAVQLLAKKQVWLSAGVMPSYIGFEAAIGTQNWTLTRSIMANNSPYFVTGLRLDYNSANQKWLIALLVLNGWQNIVDNNNNKAIGTQLTYTPSSRLTINSSGFWGEAYNRVDSLLTYRFFHNFYCSWQPHPKWALAKVIDISLQQIAPQSHIYQSWWTAAFFIRYFINSTSIVIARLEYFYDSQALMIKVNNFTSFRTGSFSIGYDYTPLPNALLRIEGKYYFSREPIFEVGSSRFSSNSLVWTASMGYQF
ncbi:MAG: outer membrane beta-barrel protein [Bacteroidia bacterium]|nr:porin [Bacteroidia bacterium]MDW8159454.1 outer membrane beta-barrel protein [Bacteroidia bacterium]